MSYVLGQPGFVPSNTTGSSGITEAQMGHLGSGVLQTIEEGQGALSSEPFYMPKGVGYYQLPSTQRSYGDDRKTMAITTFGSRGTVTLPRKWFHWGPSAMRFRLPIDYAWAGCEYTTTSYISNGSMIATGPGIIGNNTYYAAAFTPAQIGNNLVAVAARDHSEISRQHFFFEQPGCSTMLPTSFQSGGMAFAFPQSIELNLGGAGQITFDRYSNFAAIMASTPSMKMRKDLMRMAGGGLNLYDEDEMTTAPVVWGQIPWKNSAGNSYVTYPGPLFLNLPNNAQTDVGIVPQTPVKIDLKREVPIAWDVFLPIKTPDTNFYYSYHKKKPLDSSLFAGDLQFTFTWSNFYEWSDTGKGYPNAPCYVPQRLPDLGTPSDANYPAGTYMNPIIGSDGLRPPYTGAATYGDSFPQNTLALADSLTELGAPMLVNATSQPILELNFSTSQVVHPPSRWYSSVMLSNPVCWTNHYRVASGQQMLDGVHYNSRQDILYNFNDAAGAIVNSGSAKVGRCRLPQFFVDTTQQARDGVLVNGLLPLRNAAASYKSLQLCADQVNENITYPTKFDFVEYVNANLKLTNPALGAYNALRVDKQAVVYYPFQYTFSQVYRIPAANNPWGAIKSWNSTTLQNPYLQQRGTDVTKMSLNIQMPANPTTSMIVGIYREKDRVNLGKNVANSYSPALFWNALNPERIRLMDGGNTLFDYCNNIAAEYYSEFERPDVFKIPFRGGLCKVSPENLYGTRYSSSTSHNVACQSDVIDDVLDATANGEPAKPVWASAQTATNYNWGVGTQGEGHPATSVNSFPADSLCNGSGLSYSSGKKYQPCHSTEEYEATLIEFPFVMYEPYTSERMVQQTPSFAKTQLVLDFWLNPNLKPDNGMDDMYDKTYGLTRGVPSGVPAVALSCAPLTDGVAHRSPYCYPGGIASHPVPHCLHEQATPYDLELVQREKFPSLQPGQGLSATLPYNVNAQNKRIVNQGYADGYSFANASSWNINNGDLMVHITFSQNQVWAISPLRTSILSARG